MTGTHTNAKGGIPWVKYPPACQSGRAQESNTISLEQAGQQVLKQRSRWVIQ